MVEYGPGRPNRTIFRLIFFYQCLIKQYRIGKTGHVSLHRVSTEKHPIFFTCRCLSTFNKLATTLILIFFAIETLLAAFIVCWVSWSRSLFLLKVLLFTSTHEQVRIRLNWLIASASVPPAPTCPKTFGAFNPGQVPDVIKPKNVHQNDAGYFSNKLR